MSLLVKMMFYYIKLLLLNIETKIINPFYIDTTQNSEVKLQTDDLHWEM